MSLKFYEDLNFLEKILYKLPLKKAIKGFNGCEFRRLCETQSFLENHEVDRKWELDLK